MTDNPSKPGGKSVNIAAMPGLGIPPVNVLWKS